MKKLTLLVLVLVLLVSFFNYALANEVVNVFNWEDYISEETIQLFQEETGIKVNYMNFTTNEDMLVQVEANPSVFDVVFPSDYAVERLISKNLLEEINFDNVENFNNVEDWMINPAYDSENKFSVPYMWGTVGILYNKELVDETVDSWDVLWNEKYKNNVFMLDSIRDSMGITLKYLGYSLNTREPLELEEAKEKLIEQKKLGIVKAYQVDETKDKMVNNEAAFGVVWSGDAQYAIELNEKLEYVVPKEGSNIWIDAMVIPKGAQNKENAEKFINFMCRPDVAVMNCNEIWYSTPIKQAVAEMGEEYSNNHVMNPSQETIDSCEFFHDIQDFIQIYNALWLEIKTAK